MLLLPLHARYKCFVSSQVKNNNEKKIKITLTFSSVYCKPSKQHILNMRITKEFLWTNVAHVCATGP